MVLKTHCTVTSNSDQEKVSFKHTKHNVSLHDLAEIYKDFCPLNQMTQGRPVYIQSIVGNLFQPISTFSLTVDRVKGKNGHFLVLRIQILNREMHYDVGTKHVLLKTTC